ncbi:Glycine betaine/carnitine/choline transport ATP-binding protein OpuCA [Jeotgalibaca dankookensis]|uniref:Glycine betaine/carnitine/choline transport ATP-binding protein OpuCA n=1 Tax=Jeotgalibaca dankookensis TaxID=708126 RepID=A0A1S6IPS4_9LACT|nr:ABC transporter ATP-binding protein [Jeotgalibaca dankookensis]AQS53561.1 Glycine betaine/carnitine/choline transport ATP-binding protein OpuCA [Jeotgalibaca dankookensis]
MIEICDVHKQFGRKKILEGVSFSIKSNEITCITGLNGSGKTTLMNTIMQLTPLKQGSLLIDGERLTKEKLEKISYIADTVTMPHSMSIQECIVFMQVYYQNWNQKKAQDLLTFFNLNPNDRLKDLSKGNQAKANFLLGLAQEADYYLMDEPFSGIDLFAREQIMEVFTSKLVENKGVLLATHHLDEVETLVDRVVMLNEGMIVQDFYAEEMRERRGKSVIDMMREVYQG